MKKKTFIFDKLYGELLLWKKKWENNLSDMPQDGSTAYSACDEVIFPYLKAALSILCVLPASVATGERSFSALNRLKTWLRSTMSQDRLVGLALLHIHRDIEIDVNVIIDKFAKDKKRNINLLV